MSDETLLQRLQKAANFRKLEVNSKKSIEWFRQNAARVIGVNSQQKLHDRLQKEEQTHSRLSGRSPIGKMFTYDYSNPKYKDSLPYFDRFPLILYIGPGTKGSFYGLNLHYLPPMARAVFFDNLLRVSSSPAYSAQGKIRLTYNLLNGSRKLKMFQPCFKKYLFSHVRGKIIEIPYTDWEKVLFLPIQFAKSKNSAVWSDSMLQIKK